MTEKTKEEVQETVSKAIQFKPYTDAEVIALNAAIASIRDITNLDTLLDYQSVIGTIEGSDLENKVGIRETGEFVHFQVTFISTIVSMLRTRSLDFSGLLGVIKGGMPAVNGIWKVPSELVDLHPDEFAALKQIADLALGKDSLDLLSGNVQEFVLANLNKYDGLYTGFEGLMDGLRAKVGAALVDAVLSIAQSFKVIFSIITGDLTAILADGETTEEGTTEGSGETTTEGSGETTTA